MKEFKEMDLFEIDETIEQLQTIKITKERQEEVGRLEIQLENAKKELSHPELNERCSNCDGIHDGSHDIDMCKYLNR